MRRSRYLPAAVAIGVKDLALGLPAGEEIEDERDPVQVPLIQGLPKQTLLSIEIRSSSGAMDQFYQSHEFIEARTKFAETTGAPGRTRTSTTSRPPDFESGTLTPPAADARRDRVRRAAAP